MDRLLFRGALRGPVTPWRSRAVRAGKGRHGRERGQSLIVFALSITLLIALGGLAVDIVRAYDLYAKELRAAEAGALAGVVYMPNFYNSAYPVDNDCAINRALKEIQKNSPFGPTAAADCLSGVPAPTPNACTDNQTFSGVVVTVCRVNGATTALEVTIKQQIDVVLMSALGFGSFNVVASAKAVYIPPIILGSGDTTSLDSYFFGNAGSCSNGNGGSSGCNSRVSNFAAAINGPAELKESGDPYVYCEEGPSDLKTNGNAPDPAMQDPASGSQAYKNSSTDYNTNHKQSGGSNCPDSGNNSNTQGQGFCGVYTCATGKDVYSYSILPCKPPNTTCPSSLSNGNLWLFNPNYIPFVKSGTSCGGSTQVDGFFETADCAQFYGKYSPSQLGNLRQDNKGDSFFDDPRFYFDVTYSLYRVKAQLDRSGDELLWSHTFRPYSAMPADLRVHGCTNSQVYDFSAGSEYENSIPQTNGGCVNIPNGTNAVCQTNGAGLPTSPCQYQWFEVFCTNTSNNGSTPSCPNTGQPLVLNPANCPDGCRLAVEATSYAWDLVTNQGDTTYTGCQEFTCGYGWHSYGVEACNANITDPVKNCNSGKSSWIVGPWNDFAMRIIPPSGNTNNSVPLGFFNETLAGRTITVSVFDAGDSIESASGNNFLAIVPPPQGTNPCVSVPITDAASNLALRTGTPGGNPGYFPSSNGACVQNQWIQTAASSNNLQADNIYNGLWLVFQIKLPTTYQAGQWWLNLQASQSNDFEELAVQVDLNGGSPVHLAP